MCIQILQLQIMISTEQNQNGIVYSVLFNTVYKSAGGLGLAVVMWRGASRPITAFEFRLIVSQCGDYVAEGCPANPGPEMERSTLPNVVPFTGSRRGKDSRKTEKPDWGFCRMFPFLLFKMANHRPIRYA